MKSYLQIIVETAMGLQLNIQETNGDHAVVFDKYVPSNYITRYLWLKYY